MTPDRPGRLRWRIVAALAVTQTIGYGVLSYAFPVLLVPMRHDLRASTATITGAMTVAVLAGAVTAVPVGRWLDRHGGRTLMSAGSVAATLLVAAWSQVRTVPQLYAVLAGVGVASAAVLYEAAFAVVVGWFDASRRGEALLAVVLVAGMASSIAMPVTGVLVEAVGWRGAVLVLAVAYGAITVPLHLTLPRPPRPPIRDPGRRQGRSELAAILTTRAFGQLAAVFVAHGAAVAVISVQLVLLLRADGHSPRFAASVAGLLGLMSVTGRLVVAVLRRWLALPGIIAVIFLGQAAGAVLLAVAGRSPAGAVAGVVVFGVGFGVASLARPLVVAQRFGAQRYGTVSGLLAVPLALVKAFAPLAASLVLPQPGGATVVLLGVAALSVAAAALVRAGAGPDRGWAVPEPVPGCETGAAEPGAVTAPGPGEGSHSGRVHAP